MPTVTELLNRGSRITGLRTTGSEREIALEALQDAYRRALIDAEAYPEMVSHTITEVGDTYILETMLGEAPAKLLHVSQTTAANPFPLQQVSHQEILDLRDLSTTQGTPAYYAAVGWDRIAFCPNPAVGDQINFWYIPDTPTLVEADPAVGEEISPTMIPVQFHWAVLLPGMVLELLDKDQRIAESNTWQERYERGIARLQEFMGQFGGTANRAYVKKSSGFRGLNDERRRP